MPFGHLAVDCIMLAIWLWHAHSLYQRKTDYLPSRIEPVLFFQEGGSVTFDPRFIDPPAEFLLLASGTLPAMLISGVVRPEAHILTPSKLWDPVWFSVHEIVSFGVWFVVGVLLDSGLLRITRLMAAYLAVRFGFAVLLTVHGVAQIGWRIEVLAWLAFGVYAIVVGLRWALTRARLRRTAADS